MEVFFNINKIEETVEQLRRMDSKNHSEAISILNEVINAYDSNRSVKIELLNVREQEKLGLLKTRINDIASTATKSLSVEAVFNLAEEMIEEGEDITGFIDYLNGLLETSYDNCIGNSLKIEFDIEAQFKKFIRSFKQNGSRTTC